MGPDSPAQVIKGIVDGGTISMAFTSPWWIQAMHTWIGLFMLFGGALLLGLRLAISWREWRRK